MGASDGYNRLNAKIDLANITKMEINCLFQERNFLMYARGKIDGRHSLPAMRFDHKEA